MALQSSGTISIRDILIELGLSPSTEIRVSGRGTPSVVPPLSDSLFGRATGVINKTVPHAISEFYGYNQVLSFVMSTNPYDTALEACDDTDLGATLWHEGSGTYPEVGDKIWNEGTSTTPFAGNDKWYKIPGEDHVVLIGNDGIVDQKEDCNQTFTIQAVPSVVDSDAQSVTITITSNVAWNLATTQVWAKWDSNNLQTISGTGNATLTLNLLENTSGLDRNVIINGSFGLGTKSTDIDQLSGSFTNTSLRYSAVDGPTSCSQTPVTFLTDTGSLSTASVVYNALGGTPAPAGFYSDGSIWKEVGSNGIVLSGGDICGL